MVTRITKADTPAGADGQTEHAPAADGFADLLSDAQSIEAGGKPGEAPPNAALDAGPDASQTTAEAREVVELVASLALPFVAYKWGADIAALYNRPALDRIGGALGAVAVKRGWSLETAMAGWGPEIALAAALVGPALPALMKRMQERDAPKPTPAPPPDLVQRTLVTPHDASSEPRPD